MSSDNELLPATHPYAFIGLATASRYIKRGDLSTEDKDDNPALWTRFFLNSTTDVLEGKTNRLLAARSYRTATSFDFVLTENSLSATCADAADLRVRDELAHESLEPGTLIDAISGTTVTLSKRALDDDASAEVTVGFGPLVASGAGETSKEGWSVIYCPEYPVQSVSAITPRLADGTLDTALDLTGLRIDAETGRLILPAASIPQGDQNLEIECVAGYLPARVGRMGGFTDWSSLQLTQSRMVKIGWSDFLKGFGRTANQQFGEVNEFINDYRWPADIVDTFARYRRMW